MKKKSCNCMLGNTRGQLEYVNGKWRCSKCKTTYVKLKSLDFECKKNKCNNLYYDERRNTMTCHSCGKIMNDSTGKEIHSICEDMNIECIPQWDFFHKIMKCQVCGDIFVQEGHRPKNGLIF